MSDWTVTASEWVGFGGFDTKVECGWCRTDCGFRYFVHADSGLVRCPACMEAAERRAMTP